VDGRGGPQLIDPLDGLPTGLPTRAYPRDSRTMAPR
jgi:hypothetical protein